MELAGLQRRVHNAQTKKLAISTAFSTADYISDVVLLVNLLVNDPDNSTLGQLEEIH